MEPAEPRTEPAEPRREPAEPHADQALAALLAAVPFIGTLGIEVMSATPQEVIGRLGWRQ
jgi:hypothetical protein